MRKFLKFCLVTGICTIIIGGGMFCFGMSKLDWDFSKLDTNEYTEETKVLSVEEIAALTDVIVNADSTTVEINKISNGEAPRIIWFSTETNKVTVNCDNGVININEEHIWSIKELSIFYNSFQLRNKGVTIYLPDKDYEKLEVNLDSGTVKINNIKAKDFSVNIDSGTLKINNVKAGKIDVSVKSGTVAADNITDEGNLEVNVRSGTVKLNNVTAITSQITIDSGTCYLYKLTTDILSINVDSGTVKLNNVTAITSQITIDSGTCKLDRLTTDNLNVDIDSGTIKGDIVGDKEEYNIYKNVRSGSCNLQNQNRGTNKNINIELKSGSIKINFV